MSEAAADHSLVTEHTVYACVMGSRAFGLATETSDTDRRGVFLAPTPLFWGFEKPPTHVEGPREEEFSWELERFCQLALRANPTVLECLHSPLVERIDTTGRELLTLREAFLSRQVHRTFAGYAGSQLKQLRADVRQHGAPRWKHAMHLLRILACSATCSARASSPSTSARTGTTCWRSAAARSPGTRWNAEWPASPKKPKPRSPAPHQPALTGPG